MPHISRSGHFIKQPGYEAFIPAPLPPESQLEMREDLVRMLSDADRAIGQFDGVVSTLPVPELVTDMFIRQEALFSSRIEGAVNPQVSLLEFELNARGQPPPPGLRPVTECMRALCFGLERVEEAGVCLRFIRDVHARMFEGVRGGQSWPGEFRKSQNWVGAPKCTLQTADYVPPPVHEMHHALDHLERFLRNRESLPVLVRCALVHAQFETIHPFLEGNGRLGRLLVPFILRWEKRPCAPLLCLSRCLLNRREEYFGRLDAVRRAGSWEEWVIFFLGCVRDTAQNGVETVLATLALRENHRQRIIERGKRTDAALALLDFLHQHPVTSISRVSEQLGCVYVTAAKIVGQFVELGILTEATGHRRNRRFICVPYLNLFAGI